MREEIRKSLLFIGLTFLCSYALVILFFVLGGKWNTPGSMIVGIGYMFIPMIVALVVQKFINREPVKAPLGISWKLNRWFLVAWLLPPVMAFATFGVSLLFPGVEYAPDMAGMFERFKTLLTQEQMQQMEQQAGALPIHPIWIGLLLGLLAGITINAVAGFGEELGWRGFLQRHLCFLGFWRSSALIGVIWGIWHAPIILQGHNYPEHPVAGVFMMTVFCLLLAPIFSYIRVKAKSVLAAAILHGSLNGTVGLAVMVVKGGSDLTIGVTGAAGFIVLVVVNIGMVLYDRFLASEPILLCSHSR